MTEQLQLGFRPTAPAVDPTDLERFIRTLCDAPDWIKARDLTRVLSFDDRYLRALASSSRGTIISGNRGYRLTRLATIQEIDRCTSTLRSQADAMTARALQIARVYHGHEGIKA
jgi:hypothetical protein